MRSSLVAAGLLLMAVAVPARAEEGEPGTYAGKPAAWWVEELTKRETEPVAHSALKHIGEPALPALVDGLGNEDYDESVRARIANLLVRIPGDTAPLLEGLVAALDPRRTSLTHDVLLAISRAGPAAKSVLPQVAVLAAHRDRRVKQGVAVVLGAIGPPIEDVLPLLAPLLADRSTDVRKAALRAVGSIGELAPAALDAIHAGMRDAHAAVRRTALDALSKLPRDAPEVLALLREAVASPYPAIRAAGIHQVARDLAEQRSDAKRALLLEAIDDESPDVRKAALRGVASLPDLAPVAVPLVMARLGDVDRSVRITAADTLGKIGTGRTDAAEALLAAFVDPELRRAVYAALGKLRPQVTPLLLQRLAEDAARGVHSELGQLLRDPSDEEVAYAVPMLAERLGDPEFPQVGRIVLLRWMQRPGVLRPALVPALCAALRVRDPEVEQLTTTLLGMLARKNDLELLFAELADSEADHERLAAILVFAQRPLTAFRLKVLNERLDDPIAYHRMRAALATTGIHGNWDRNGPPDIARHVSREKVAAALVEGLDSRYPAWIRTACLGTLSHQLPHSRDAVPQVAPFLQSSERQAVVAAAEFLWRVDTEASNALLLAGLEHADPLMRLAIAEVAARRHYGAVRVLDALLDHEDARVRAAALGTWRNVGGSRIWPKGRSLARVGELLGDDDPEVVRLALALVQTLPLNEKVYGLLSTRVVDRALPTMTRYHLVYALRRFRGRAVSLFAELLTDPSLQIRSAAITSLTQLGPAALDAVPALERLAQDENAALAELARAALKFIRGEQEGE